MTDSEVPQGRTGRISKTASGSKLISTKPITYARTWIRHERSAELQADGFYISYNGNTAALGSFMVGDEASDETALCKDGRYYILNGDFRKEYEALVDDGFEACLRFFLSKPELVSSWSNEVGSDLVGLNLEAK